MRSAVLLTLAALLIAPHRARAWGDEGHEIIALIADALLRPEVRRQVHALLETDEDPLTEHDIAAEATWADHYRNADPDGARSRTRRWHFADIELAAPSLEAACFGRPPLPPGVMAAQGPARDCVVDKIDQFTTELASRDTPPDERLIALKYLLHFVGDVHQPLHAADDDDRGGNDKRVTAPGFPAGSLHHYWDTEFVVALGPGSKPIADSLLRNLSPVNQQRWSSGTPADWARDSFQVARDDTYGRLPVPSRRGSYQLDQTYVDIALRDCRQQLTRAGVRLAALLNHSFAGPPRRPASPAGGRAPR